MNEETARRTATAVEAAIRIALVALLVVWCFMILEPFLIPVLWGMIVAIAVYPAYAWLQRTLGNRRKLAATLIAGLIVLFIVLGGSLVTGSLVSGASGVKDVIQKGVEIPPVPESVSSWPLLGKPVADIWNLARTNLDGLLSRFGPQIGNFLVWILESATNIGLAFLMFIVSTVIAGVFLATSEAGGRAAREIGKRVMGARGEEFVNDAGSTIRNVARGVLGVAVIQTVLAGLGFAVAGVPAAGLWTLFCLILAVVQIGIGPVVVPVVIYMFYTTDTLTATLLTIWLGFALVIDNILKPILLGRKAPVPMLVVFLGSIGGFLMSGIIGLFVGAVVLSLGYKLFLTWLREETA